MAGLFDEYMKRTPSDLRLVAQKYGVLGSDLLPPTGVKAPYTSAGASGLFGPYVLNDMMDGTRGVTIANNRDGASSTPSLMFYNKSVGKTDKLTPGHEMEHVLANQGFGRASALNTKWDELVGDGAKRLEMVQRLVEHAPYLASKYGLPPNDVNTGYFSKDVLSSGQAHNYLYEQLATLSALEQAQNASLTKDPYLRKNVFKTPAERETYNALTGLRQSRLDAKDLPPYTRQPE